MSKTCALRTPLLREALGDVLRALRAERGQTLRDVSSRASVSLGYLSEVERGHKEASSELLAAICDALDVDLATVLLLAARRVEPIATVTPLRAPGDAAAA